MVVFTCNHCGDSLQKPKVEKHYSFVCRRDKSLTCVDCLKDFFGEEYSVHVKCLTEEERYSAKGTFKNGDVKKGELKQELWSDIVRGIIKEKSDLSPKCRNLMNHIVNFSNVPRKKPKFINFMRSSMGNRVDLATLEEVWNIIEEYKTKYNEAVKRKNEHVNGNSEKKLKTETDKSEEIKVEAEEKSAEKFDMNDEILRIVQKKSSIPKVKLHKKILKKYCAFHQIETSDKFDKKFNKSLKKLPNISIENEIISVQKDE